MAEFTGERVIPELVDPDLLNEHLARYRFAAHFIQARNARVHALDAGCGSGYGSAELAKAGAVVTGTDISADAIADARQRYEPMGVRFLTAPCEALPFEPATFDLVTAFEVIEHLDRWQELLTEANRVLKADGVLLVSTPNRDYYTESRGTAGPNPFHVHEFSYEEFREALKAVFPHVRIWTQNHAGAVVFSRPGCSANAVEAAGGSDPASAHFYLAACSQAPVTASGTFAWVPSSANVLRERERHIAKLTGELEQKDAWLRQSVEAHAELQRKHESVTAELVKANNWAEDLNRELGARNARIVELQQEVEARLTWIADLESQIEAARIAIGHFQKEQVVAGGEIARLEALVAERTTWAESLNIEIAGYRGELQRIGASNWFRAGAKLGIGPRLRDGQ